MEYLFMVCQYMDGNSPVMRQVQVIKNILYCDRQNVGCGEGLQVVFAHTEKAVNVRETECLFVTEENKNELTYQK